MELAAFCWGRPCPPWFYISGFQLLSDDLCATVSSVSLNFTKRPRGPFWVLSVCLDKLGSGLKT